MIHCVSTHHTHTQTWERGKGRRAGVGGKGGEEDEREQEERKDRKWGNGKRRDRGKKKEKHFDLVYSCQYIFM